ncbi:MAG: SurA N-terminal domain-containing protein [Deltaproteobacteria bacterium]|jgi:peptidyl-prolyl cis-trans isomerase SurA|nr:SurA N-terminal domain-containing protein [Deltaproteobacteria bacterium]
MIRCLNFKIILQRFVWFSLWVFAIAGSTPARGDEIVERIVAVVNDDIITYLEVQKEMSPYEAQIKAAGYDPEKEQQMLYRVRSDVINQLVEQKITDQEIKRYNITVNDEDIDRNIEQIKQDKLWTDEEFRKALEREGMTIELYREKLKEQALRARLINRVVRANIVITNEDVAAYYANNIEKYQGELTYHLRNIIMRVPGGADTTLKQAVLERMEDIHAQLEQGVSFVSLARKYSESVLAKNGGDLGNLPYKDFSSQLKEALKGLSKGEYTAVLDTDQGYQIFLVENILKENEISLEDAYSEIESNLYKELSEKAFVDWLKNLREASHIKIIL